jgi:hypothetical protein
MCPTPDAIWEMAEKDQAARERAARSEGVPESRDQLPPYKFGETEWARNQFIELISSGLSLPDWIESITLLPPPHDGPNYIAEARLVGVDEVVKIKVISKASGIETFLKAYPSKALRTVVVINHHASRGMWRSRTISSLQLARKKWERRQTHWK